MNISNNAGIDSNDLAKRGESLIRKSTNRYLTTVRIAFRAKQRKNNSSCDWGTSVMGETEKYYVISNGW